MFACPFDSLTHRIFLASSDVRKVDHAMWLTSLANSVPQFRSLPKLKKCLYNFVLIGRSKEARIGYAAGLHVLALTYF